MNNVKKLKINFWSMNLLFKYRYKIIKNKQIAVNVCKKKAI